MQRNFLFYGLVGVTGKTSSKVGLTGTAGLVENNEGDSAGSTGISFPIWIFPVAIIAVIFFGILLYSYNYSRNHQFQKGDEN